MLGRPAALLGCALVGCTGSHPDDGDSHGDSDTALHFDPLSDVAVTVVDWESEDLVGGVEVAVFESDFAEGAPDTTADADADGVAVLDLPACAPVVVRVVGDSGDEANTYEAHRVFAPGTTVIEQRSMNRLTYQIIPSLLAVAQKEENGLVTGVIVDGSGAVVQHATVTVSDPDGTIDPSATVDYFVNSFPNREQPDTSADGMFVATNVGPGLKSVEAFAEDESPIASSSVWVYPSSANVATLVTGADNSVVFPEACR